MGYVILLAVALTIFLRSTTTVERRKYLFAVLKRLDLFILRVHGWWRELAPFRAALRARTPIAPVTPVLAVLNIVVAIAAGVAVAVLLDRLSPGSARGAR